MAIVYDGYCINHIKQVREMFLKKDTLTVDEINKALSSGTYATKYVAMMRKYLNFDITVNKDGRTVLSYTFVGDTDMDLNQWDKPAKKKKVKEKKEKVAKVKKEKPVKAASKPNKKVVVVEDDEDDVPVMDRNSKSVRDDEDFAEPLVMSSYSVDNDWDSIDDQGIRDLLR